MIRIYRLKAENNLAQGNALCTEIPIIQPSANGCSKKIIAILGRKAEILRRRTEQGEKQRARSMGHSEECANMQMIVGDYFIQLAFVLISP